MEHQHLLVKADIIGFPEHEDIMNRFLEDIVDAINMKVLMAPRSRYLNEKGNRGMSGDVVIETSHVSCHIWDERKPALLQLDVYSCKGFDPKAVLRVIDYYFIIVSHRAILLDRSDEIKVIRSIL